MQYTITLTYEAPDGAHPTPEHAGECVAETLRDADWYEHTKAGPLKYVPKIQIANAHETVHIIKSHAFGSFFYYAWRNGLPVFLDSTYRPLPMCPEFEILKLQLLAEKRAHNLNLPTTPTTPTV